MTSVRWWIILISIGLWVFASPMSVAYAQEPDDEEPEIEEPDDEEPEVDEPDVEDTDEEERDPIIDDEEVVDAPDEPILDVGQDRTAAGVFFGYDLDNINDPFIGADVRLSFSMDDFIPMLSLVANPAFSFYFISGATLWQIDANALARLDLDGPVRPFAGLGFVIAGWSDAAATDINLTINPFIGGAEFDLTENIDAFAQVRATRHSFGEPGFLFTFTTWGLMAGAHLRF